MYVDTAGGTLTVLDTNFTANSAPTCGVMMAQGVHRVTVTGGAMVENEATAGEGGGACFTQPDPEATVSQCVNGVAQTLGKAAGDLVLFPPGLLLPLISLECQWVLPPTVGCSMQLTITDITGGLPSGAKTKTLHRALSPQR